MVPSSASNFLNTDSPGTNPYCSLPYDDVKNLWASWGIHTCILGVFFPFFFSIQNKCLSIFLWFPFTCPTNCWIKWRKVWQYVAGTMSFSWAASHGSQVGSIDLFRVDINKAKCVRIVNCRVYHSVFNNTEMYTVKNEK